MALRDIRFASNRKPLAGGFGDECEPEKTRLRLGQAQVADAASPLLDGRVMGGSVMVDMSDATAAQQIGWLADWLAGAADEGRVPLLYVHGFCFSFADALARAGQIAAFYEGGPQAVRLAPLVFCWPSNGTLTSDAYLLDREDCARSDHALAELLHLLAAAAAASGVRPMLLAHSMGAYMLRLGVTALAGTGSIPAAPPFAQAAVIAGDDEWTVLDRGGKLRALAELATWVTVGVFAGDSVVYLNDVFRNRPTLLGWAGPARPEEMPPNVAIVDYGLAGDWQKEVPQELWREIAWNWRNHQYYRNDIRVRADLAQVFRDRPPAEVLGRKRGEALFDSNFGIRTIPGRLYPTGEEPRG